MNREEHMQYLMTGDLEEIAKEDALKEAADRSMSQFINQMNQNTVRFEGPSSDGVFNIMDRMLRKMIGRLCDVQMKNGGSAEGLILKAYDREYLILYGYFDVGRSNPIYREVCISRSEVQLIMEHINREAIFERIQRNYIRYGVYEMNGY